jgi:hypothetical protein
MIATALIVGLLAGSAASAHANSKQKNEHKQKTQAHKTVGLSPVDFPRKAHGDKDHGDKDCRDHDHHGRDQCNDRCGKDHGGKDHSGKHHCGNNQCNGNDSCKNGSKPPKEYMGGSIYSPPGTPGNPVMPSKPTLPTTPIKYYGLKNGALASSLFNQHTGPTPPRGRPGQGGTPSQGSIPNIGTGWSGLAGGYAMMGMELGGAARSIGYIGKTVGSTAVQVAEGMYTGVSGLVGEAGSILGDIL